MDNLLTIISAFLQTVFPVLDKYNRVAVAAGASKKNLTEYIWMKRKFALRLKLSEPVQNRAEERKKNDKIYKKKFLVDIKLRRKCISCHNRTLYRSKQFNTTIYPFLKSFRLHQVKSFLNLLFLFGKREEGERKRVCFLLYFTYSLNVFFLTHFDSLSPFFRSKSFKWKALNTLFIPIFNSEVQKKRKTFHVPNDILWM